MRKLSVFSIIVVGLSSVGGGCNSPPSQRREPRAAAESPKPVPAGGRATKSNAGKFTAANNPTTLAGRGQPNLEDKARPAAWVFVDGQAGKFTEREGELQTQWVIEGPVCATPTFRVEGYEPLLGNPTDFKFVLQAVEASDASNIVYGIAANVGTFIPGREYSLLNPGDDFVIRNGLTGDVVKEIAPLSPGTYGIVGGLENRSTGKRALAVTYFTVGEEK